MKELAKHHLLIEESSDYKDLHSKLKSEEKVLLSSGLDSISYAQFVGFNIRLERLISVIIDSKMDSSDSFEKWKNDWNSTFMRNIDFDK